MLEKKIDRRQFLGTLGASTLIVTGAAGIVDGLRKLKYKPASRGYSASSYGGASEDSLSPSKRS